MKLTAEQLYKKLVVDYKIIGETGSIKFTVKDLVTILKLAKRQIIKIAINIQHINGYDLAFGKNGENINIACLLWQSRETIDLAMHKYNARYL